MTSFLRLMALAVGLAACAPDTDGVVSEAELRPGPEATAPDGEPPHILLVVLDTVRADHSSTYGYDRETTPALSQLAETYSRATILIPAAA